ncbi:NUDIX hydrolase [Nocardia donostiensis]|uniref:NTP pyrophosphohydrolase n=1 Tax=Nocardia donostiensis TaxID=1538463 RepID=A0A1V2TJ80_9NOCA|nr:NUDIX hydrolase [Nocardia donostiensis]ONM49518.1 NTP pyrophosphohydrolase [Nocardia donostiensis]OQS13502.1 NTP pyrophosphohydrolase [Nocardia donostiensis]OQS19995.1 NTP pyrophosphohydrolase [Nocardia donostiensis]
MRGDGDGWSRGPDGVRHWGRFGAAGLLLRAPLGAGGSAVLLQHRAAWSHEGGTWALPGGARDSHETPVHAAVREAGEEAGIKAGDVRVRVERVTATAPSGWSYTTVIADAAETLPTSANGESVELAWVPEDEVDQRPLHPGFAAAWPSLRALPARLDLSAVPADDAEELAEALPRTVYLAGQGFVWLHTEAAGPGERAAIVGDEAAASNNADVSVPAAPTREPGQPTALTVALTFTRGQLLA